MVAVVQNIFPGMTVAEIRRQARNDAEAVLAVYGDGEIPVDPVRIARDIGAQVFEAQMGDDTYGMVTGDANGVSIYVDVDNPPVRKRFTIAHELGHVVAHQGSLTVGTAYVEKRSDENAGTADEIHANEFAASLLMPADLLRDEFENDSNLLRLARKFNVSVAAMGWRLRHLGLAT